MVGQVSYQTITCRSALNRSRHLPFQWSLNPYRGCQHACRYCFARASHTYFDLGPGRDFEQIILAKSNLPHVLRRELNLPSRRGQTVGIGTVTDPYQPAEATCRITRRCLEMFAEMAHPCSLTTKGVLALRDLDVMQQLARDSSFHVNFSLITLDRDVWQRLEPGVPSPMDRLKALDRLRSAGVPTGVLLAPVLPGLTDSEEQLSEVVRCAAEYGATTLWVDFLRLKPGIKAWFIAFLRNEFPQLVSTYERAYAAGVSAPVTWRERVLGYVEAAKKQVVFRPMPTTSVPERIGRQLTLPWEAS